jgi:predicted nucleotidyltransferase component of viral defense system
LNFFIQNFPRLSVDIDLSYTKIDAREEALAYITASMEDLSKTIIQRFPGSRVTKKRISGGAIRGLIVNFKNAVVKVEPNLVMRGTVFPGKIHPLRQKVKDMFQMEMDIPLLSVPDLYGGKLCAALDRQHPRDLFDARLLLDTEGISRSIVEAFLVYLISHLRPMAEILSPNLMNISSQYEQEFRYMTEDQVSIEELLNTREEIIRTIHRCLTDYDKQFLLSVKAGEPKWPLFSVSHIQYLPAVRWKCINIDKMTAEKRRNALVKLEDVLKGDSS